MDLDEEDGDNSQHYVEFPDSAPSVARLVLRDAAQQLTARGLNAAAKWALELLVHVPSVPGGDDQHLHELHARGSLQRPVHGNGQDTLEGVASSSVSAYYYSTPAAAQRYARSRSRASEHSPQMPVEQDVGHGYPYQSTPALNPERGATPSLLEDSASGHPVPLPPTPLAALNRGRTEAIDGDIHDASHLSPGMRATNTSTPASAHVHFAASTQPSSSSSAMAEDEHAGGNGEPRSFQGPHYNMEGDEYDEFLLAKNLFDHHQWERCARILEKKNAKSSASIFLKTYARYLLIERRAEEDYFQATKWVKGKHAPRSALVPLLRDLIDPRDPFLLFLKGIILRKLDKRIEAIDCFIRSIEQFPYNWGAWQELSTSLEGGQAELQDVLPMLPNSFMTSFFLELFARSSTSRMVDESALRRIDGLLEIFPDAPYLLICRGQILHLSLDLEASEEAYEAARLIDPLRLEGMADYSNSLFVQNKEEKLANLTHELAEAGREDAEVCCAIGNYYTLRGQNDRAVEVFKRAVRLDPSCSSAWILLGHGYIELKDSLAAAEMYRKALKLNPRDVRAWTGLGNTYELNSAWAQALHYHKKAAANSPYDFRFWASMSNCYDQLGQLSNAIECYERILTLEQNVDMQLLVMDDIARAYEALAASADDQEDDENAEETDASGMLTADDDESNSPRAQNMMRACSWHRRIAEFIDITPFEDSSEQAVRIKKYVASFLVAARWEIELAEKDFGVDSSRASNAAAAAVATEGMTGGAHSSSAAPSEMATLPENVFAQRIVHVDKAQHYLQHIMMTGTEAIIQAEELQKKLALLQT